MPHFSSRKGRIGATNCGKSRLFAPLNERSYNRLVFNPKGTTDRLLNPSVTLLRFIVLLTVHEDDASACFRPSSSTLTGLIVSRYSSIDPMLSYDRWVIVFSLFFYCIFRVTLAGYTREGSPKSAVDSTIVPTLGVILSWKTVFPLYVTSMGREKSTSLM